MYIRALFISQLHGKDLHLNACPAEYASLWSSYNNIASYQDAEDIRLTGATPLNAVVDERYIMMLFI